MIKNGTCIFLVFSSCFFSAQEKTSDIDSIQIQNKLIVTPYKSVNQNISIITKADIANSPAKSIDEILQEIPGMDIRRRGANGVQSDLGFRGSSFEQVLLLLNGVRMNDSQTGHNTLNLPVDLDDVERIEIIKGPAARRFGQNAFAGAINIITKVSPKKNVKISAEYGDYESYNLGFKANLGNEKFAQTFQTNTNSSEGYRHNTDFDIRNVFYQNQLKIKNGNIGLQAGFSEKKFGANGFYSSPKATEQYEELQSSIISIAHQQSFKNVKINSNLYWKRGQDMYLYNREKPEIYRNMHIGNNIGGEVNTSYLSKLGTTGLGVEVRKEFLVSNNLGNRNRFVSQAFLEHHFSLFQNKLNISPGISWANYSKEGNFFYPGLDIGYSVNAKNKFYGNISKVHRVPTFTELYYISKTEEGNVNLVPENAISSEIGYQFTTKNISIKTSLFSRNSKNAIDWFKTSLNDAIWKAQNVGEIDTKGTEIQFVHQPLRWLKYDVSYTYLDTHFTKSSEYVSRYVLDNLKHQIIGKLETKIISKITNEIVYRYNDRLNLGSYHLLDDKISFTQNNYSIYLLVNNITNTNYTETFGLIMPKRWFHIGFTWKILN